MNLSALLLPLLAAPLLAAAPAAQGTRPAVPQPGSPAVPGAANQAPNQAARPGARPAPQGGGAAPAPIQAEGDLYILNFSESGDGALNLSQFVKLCQTATGRNFIVTDPVESQLKTVKVRMYGVKRIPKAEFYFFFQIMMFIHDFATIEVGPSHLSVTVIQSLTQPARGGQGGLKQRAVYVLPEELEQYADQPAVLITTVVTLPNTDVRNLTTSLRALQSDAQTQGMLSAGTSNSVVLTGFGSNIAALAKLLYVIDEASAQRDGPVPVFEKIDVEFASAEEVAELLEQLLEAGRNIVAAGQAQQQGVQTPRRGNQAETKILTDARTNSLIVMALEEDMPRIKNLVAQLDVDVIEPERNFHIYNLENVQADELADTLEDFLSDAQRVSTNNPANNTGGRVPTSSSSSSRDEVVVVPDQSTNSLLIAASKTRYQDVLELVRQLDRRQDQVLIETALIELTGNDFRDMGVELGLADIPSMATAAGGFGVTSFDLSSFEDTNGDGIPDSRIPNQQDGITAGILDGGDFGLPFLVRFFESKDNSNVLNVPSVLVNNNGSARVQITDSFPTTNVTGVGAGTQVTETFGEYVDAGITLEISPSIKASRYLRLNISLNVSNFLGVVTGSIPPPKTERNLTTVVNVPDGDTMVIGGIITDTKRESSDRVPFLADIPLIGWLFRRDSDTLDKTTLYFFVTPHILHDRDFADLAEMSYRKKLEASEIIGRSRLRVIDPSFGQGDDSGPDLDPFEIPIYESPDRGEISAEQAGLDAVERARLSRHGRESMEAARAEAEQAPTEPSPAEQDAPAAPDAAGADQPVEDAEPVETPPGELR
jgi:general secretion pathway protein D